MQTIILPTDLLIDRPLLSSALVAATGQVMVKHFGSEPREWEKSYRNVMKDWDNYWRDLNLNAEDGLKQWREGRWRVTKALFRLTSLSYPPQSAMSLHLDKLPREIGRLCAGAWKTGAAQGIMGLADQGARVAILAPTQAASLVRGMAEGAQVDGAVSKFIGPDELEQVGLEGFEWRWLCSLARGDPQGTLLVTSTPSPIPGAMTAAPPGDLARLPDLLTSHAESQGNAPRRTPR